MKVRKIIILTLIFTLIFGSGVYADSITQKLKVWVNKKDDNAYASVIVDKNSYISSKLVTDKLQTILLWDEDNKKVSIFKPNVHMLTSSENKIFGEVKRYDKFKFNTFVQVDTLKVDISALKLTIMDPYEDEKLIDMRSSGDSDFPDGKDNFWITIKDISYNFDSVGTYTLRFWVKPAGETSFQVVSEKVINVVSEKVTK
jgi:hypothetical protein